jgi:predicted enzyme related to lactoylglutathione lyase
MPALQDPTGAVIAVHETACAEVVNEAGAWVMSSLHTSDPAAAAAWYREVFGWEPTPFGPLTLFTLPGYRGGEAGQPIPRETVAVMAAPDPNVPTHWSVAFGVNDTDATVERTTELGGSVLMGPMDARGFRTAVLLDPNGAAFTILQPLP